MSAASFRVASAAWRDQASRGAMVSFASNLTMMLLKLVVGAVTGSVAVLSDGVDSAEDVFSSAMAFFTIRLSARPPDEDHQYGHGKAESLAAASQAALIGIGGVFIMYTAVRRLIAGGAEIETGLGLAAMGVTLVQNVAVVGYVGVLARRSGSVALKADTRHLWTNIAQAVAVIAALVLVRTTGVEQFDPAVAMGLALFLLFSAGQVLMTSLTEAMDVALPPAEQRMIEANLVRFPEQVRGYHHLRTRKSGRQRYVDLHLLVDPRTSVADAHRTSEIVEDEIKSAMPDAVVTIHIEPDDGRYRGPMDGGPRAAGEAGGRNEGLDEASRGASP